MSRIPLVEIVETVDKIAEERPDLGDEFLKELRRFWIAKEEVYFNNDSRALKYYPWMAAFGSYEEFQKCYAQTVCGYLKGNKCGPAMKSRTKYLMEAFRAVAPDDVAIFPVVGKEHPKILLPNKEELVLEYR